MSFAGKFLAWISLVLIGIIIILVIFQFGIITGNTALVSGFIWVIVFLILFAMPNILELLQDLFDNLPDFGRIQR